MTGNYEKTLQQLEQADAKLQRAIEKKKELEARKKMLLERSEIERLCSRGTILESFLKEPLVLTNDDISSLLDLVFRSGFTQKELDEKLRMRKGIPQTIIQEDDENFEDPE